MVTIPPARPLNTESIHNEHFRRKCSAYDVTYSHIESQRAIDLLNGAHILDKMACFKHLDKLKTGSEMKLPFSKEVSISPLKSDKTQSLLSNVSNVYDSYKSSTGYFVRYLGQSIAINSLSKQQFFEIVFSTSEFSISLQCDSPLDTIGLLTGEDRSHFTILKQLFTTCQSCGQFPENSVLTRPAFDLAGSSFHQFLLYCIENSIDLSKMLFDRESLNRLFEEHKTSDSRLLYRNMDKEGMLEELSLREMSFETFKTLVLKQGSHNVVFQCKTMDYTLAQLADQEGVLIKPSTQNGGEYQLHSGFEYTGLGFQSKDRLGAFSQRVQPLDKIVDHDGKYYLEVCSTVPKVGPLHDQGHASIKLISSQGHVFCLGYYPDETRAHGNRFSTVPGKMSTKDEFITYSPNSFNHKSTRLELPTEEDFLRLKTFIEDKVQSPGEFQELNQNCARFAHDVAMHAKSRCSARVVRPFSLTDLASRINLAARLYLYRCVFSLYQAVFTLNPRSFFKRVYLPQDMQTIT